MIANSGFVAKRIAKYWRRSAEAVYPPVAMERFQVSHHSEDFYLTVSRLVPYKRIDLMVSAFAAMPHRKLVVIGDGPELARLRASAPANVVLLGAQPDHVVEDHLSRCRAFILAAVEDFGIAPLEAQAAGKPVIALAKGGALETLQNPQAEAPTAVFFHEQTAASLCQAVEEMDRQYPIMDPLGCRANAERFAPARFREALSMAIQKALEKPS
ncbi:glycosyltransferase [Paramagnetospirillum caucaseum]|uniref:glycosyltransferase n=1 Tax=Paramagnetospirillum caucaseum TaxID=1244869 RepID=UPI00034BC425|nr:glycosyltransferase [Paramagnetospirillum caucaseum]